MEIKWRQNGGKIHTRWIQDGDKIAKTRGKTQVYMAIKWIPKWRPKWRQSGDKIDTKWRQN